MNNTEKYKEQFDRGKQSQKTGYVKFMKANGYNERVVHTLNNDFVFYVKKILLSDVIASLEKKASQMVGQNASEAN